MFTKIGGRNRNSVAALNSSTGLAMSNWDPNAQDSVGNNANVTSLAIQSTTLYIGGEFTKLNGETRNGLASVNLSNGTLYVWNPILTTNSSINSLVIDGNTLYAAGNFTTVNGNTRDKIAQWNISTPSNPMLTSWTPPLSNNDIKTLAINGDTLYVGGSFTSIGGEARNRVVAFEASSGKLISNWNASVGNSEGDRVTSLALKDNQLFVGGTFTEVLYNSTYDTNYKYLVALDASTGELAPNWTPNVNNSVKALAVQDKILYIGGDFTTIKGQNKSYLCAFDLSQNTIVPSWNDKINTSVNSISIIDDQVYVGAASQAATLGTVNSSNTSTWLIDTDKPVLALTAQDNYVYLGGEFSQLANTNHSYLGALYAKDGVNYTEWNPNTPYDQVNTLALSDETLYIGGAGTIEAGELSLLAALDASTGALKDWAPKLDNTVYVIKIVGKTAYVGGLFQTLDQEPMPGFAIIALPEKP